MPDWIVAIVTSEFVWGLVLGLLLSFLGAAAQVWLLRTAQISMQREDIAALAGDFVKNIRRVVDDIAEARRRSRAIHQDLLALWK